MASSGFAGSFSTRRLKPSTSTSEAVFSGSSRQPPQLEEWVVAQHLPQQYLVRLFRLQTGYYASATAVLGDRQHRRPRPKRVAPEAALDLDWVAAYPLQLLVEVHPDFFERGLEPGLAHARPVDEEQRRHSNLPQPRAFPLTSRLLYSIPRPRGTNILDRRRSQCQHRPKTRSLGNLKLAQPYVMG